MYIRFRAFPDVQRGLGRVSQPLAFDGICACEAPSQEGYSLLLTLSERTVFQLSHPV